MGDEDPRSGVFSPTDSFPFTARCNFCGLSFSGAECCLRFERVEPFIVIFLKRSVGEECMSRAAEGEKAVLRVGEANLSKMAADE